MTLETVVFQQDPFSYGSRDIHTFGGGSPWIHEVEKAYHETPNTSVFGFNLNNWEYSSPSSFIVPKVKETDTNCSSQENCTGDGFFTGGFSPSATAGGRKRRRSRSIKNKEEIEHQRMTHITVERNRRKQMNDYLAVLRSIMPPSYVQRGDQASIIGAAINYVKELEKLFHSLEAHKRINKQSDTNSSSLFSGFFSYPQYSTHLTKHNNNSNKSTMAEKGSTIADVEVTMVDSHANIKILLRRHTKQLFKMVAGLYSLCLTILHLNITTVDHMVLYSFSVKVEDACQLNSVNEIAAAVYEMVGRIQEETISNFSCDC